MDINMNNLLVQGPRKIELYWDLKITLCCASWACALGFCVFFIVFMGAPVPQGCSQVSAGVEGKGCFSCNLRSVSFFHAVTCFVFNHTAG